MTNKYDDPAFLFYSKNFIADTYLMSYEVKGQYITLMAMQHLEEQNYIPIDTLLKVCEKTDINDIDQNIMKHLEKDEENNGYYIKHLRLTINKRKDYITSRLNNLKGNKRQENIKETMKIENNNYFSSKSLNKAFINYLQMRSDENIKTTETDIKLLIKKLNELSNNEKIQIKILNDSTLGKWKNLFNNNVTTVKETKEKKHVTAFDKYDIGKEENK